MKAMEKLLSQLMGLLLICFLTYTLLRYTEILLKSKNLFYGPGELIDILSGIERWLIKDNHTGNWYVIPKVICAEGRKIYEAFDIKRSSGSYRLATEEIPELHTM